MQSRHITNALIVFLAWIATAPPAARAASDFDYPELLVIPRASDRLGIEAAKEDGRRWVDPLPFAVSGVATLTAGLLQFSSTNPSKDPDNTSGYAGVVVGGAWVATAVAMATMHRPYGSALREVGAMPAKTTRDQLTRERFAEEAIHAQARLAKRLKWLSVTTHLAANIFMLTQTRFRSVGMVADGAGALLAFAPLVFRSRWEDVAEEQDGYKKRIYAPVADATLISEPGTGALAPGLIVSLSF